MYIFKNFNVMSCFIGDEDDWGEADIDGRD